MRGAVSVLTKLALCLVAGLVGCETRTGDDTASTDVGHGTQIRSAYAPDRKALTEAQERELERIGTLGYTVGGDTSSCESGVTVRLPEASAGYTVYVSSDYPGAYLIDLDGRVVHTWHENGAESWCRAWVYPDGSVLGVSERPDRLVKLDPDSRLLWEYGGKRLKAHHDVWVHPDGTIHVLMRTLAQLEWLRPDWLLLDFICILEPEGESVREVKCISIADAFRGSDFEDLMRSPPHPYRNREDPFHTNSVEELVGRVPHPSFKSGNILVSIRHMNCMAVIDPIEERVVWVSVGPWQRQHEARVLPNGHLMLFDNREFEDQSRVVEYDVAAEEIVWSYAEEDFFSGEKGAQQLLPNDNVLITESWKGRIFEVTREGKVVWEFWNPNRLADGETIVTVTRAFRVEHDYFEAEFAERLSE